MTHHFTLLDPDGEHHLPTLLHLCLLLLSRSYILLLLALASQQQSAQLLELFYPDPGQLYWGLALGSPALICWLAGAYRQRADHPIYHAIWRQGRWLCLGSALGELLLQLQILNSHHWFFSWPLAITLVATLWSCAYLLLNNKLTTAFVTPIDPVRQSSR